MLACASLASRSISFSTRDLTGGPPGSIAFGLACAQGVGGRRGEAEEERRGLEQGRAQVGNQAGQVHECLERDATRAAI
jgi:hypothetical protein